MFCYFFRHYFIFYISCSRWNRIIQNNRVYRFAFFGKYQGEIIQLQYYSSVEEYKGIQRSQFSYKYNLTILYNDAHHVFTTSLDWKRVVDLRAHYIYKHHLHHVKISWNITAYILSKQWFLSVFADFKRIGLQPRAQKLRASRPSNRPMMSPISCWTSKIW